MRNLTSISILPNNKNFSFIDNVNKIIACKSDTKSDTFDNLVIACRDIQKVVIRPNIKRILTDAFSECEMLSKIEFEANSKLELIDKNAFKDCFSLKSITIPDSVKIINDSAFSKCKALQKVCLTENSELERINNSAFSWTSIEYITIPKKVNFIGNNGFIVCKNLKSVEILCDQATTIGKSCFSQCKNLSIISFPNTKEISYSVESFSSCSSSFSLFIIPKAKVNFCK